MPWLLWGFVVLVAAQRLWELRLAKRNLAWATAQGGQEHGQNHYPIIVALHVAWFVAMLLEGTLHNTLAAQWWLWLVLFLLGQSLRLWAIRSLGQHWNTRIVVIPNAQRIRRGPYAFLPHPNYLAVALELASGPLIFGCVYTALVIGVLNAVVILGIRIPAEEQALKVLGK